MHPPKLLPLSDKLVKRLLCIFRVWRQCSR